MGELLSFLASGKVRLGILNELEKGASGPVLISKNLSVHTASVSRALKALEEKGLVKCITPKSNNPRFYEITPKGKKILKEVKQILKTPQ